MPSLSSGRTAHAALNGMFLLAATWPLRDQAIKCVVYSAEESYRRVFPYSCLPP